MRTLTEVLNDPDFIKGVSERFIKESKKETEELKEFYKSNEFYEVMAMLPEHLSEDCLVYGSVECGITLEQFRKFTHSITKFNTASVCEVGEYGFPIVEWEFEGIKVTHMYGQGTMVMVTKL